MFNQTAYYYAIPPEPRRVMPDDCTDDEFLRERGSNSINLFTRDSRIDVEYEVIDCSDALTWRSLNIENGEYTVDSGFNYKYSQSDTTDNWPLPVSNASFDAINVEVRPSDIFPSVSNEVTNPCTVGTPEIRMLCEGTIVEDGYTPTDYQPIGFMPSGYDPVPGTTTTTPFNPTGYVDSGYMPDLYMPVAGTSTAATGYEPGTLPTDYLPEGYVT
jgi:hypothetical protein